MLIRRSRVRGVKFCEKGTLGQEIPQNVSGSSQFPESTEKCKCKLSVSLSGPHTLNRRVVIVGTLNLAPA